MKKTVEELLGKPADFITFLEGVGQDGEYDLTRGLVFAFENPLVIFLDSEGPWAYATSFTHEDVYDLTTREITPLPEWAMRFLRALSKRGRRCDSELALEVLEEVTGE